MSEAKRFTVSDGSGDRLTGTLTHPLQPSVAPLVFLIHGLTGSENSAYMVEAARYHLAQGRPVLRINLRGAGSSFQTCKGFYHSGRWQDMFDVIAQLSPKETAHGVVVVGFSMGGSFAINMLARLPSQLPVIGGASVSAPIDPMSAAMRLMDRRNAIYQKALLKDMQATYLALVTDPAERALIESTTGVFDFDNKLTGPRHGYEDAADYYDRTAAQGVVGDISLPFLVIHAADDPWIPVAPYWPLQRSAPRNVEVSITPSGGHVGFHGVGHAQPWHDRKISQFIDRLTPS